MATRRQVDLSRFFRQGVQPLLEEAAEGRRPTRASRGGVPLLVAAEGLSEYASSLPWPSAPPPQFIDLQERRSSARRP